MMKKLCWVSLLLYPSVAFAHDPAGWGRKSLFSFVTVVICFSILVALSIILPKRFAKPEIQGNYIAICITASVFLAAFALIALLRFWVFEL
jgi:hypothetical protein